MCATSELAPEGLVIGHLVRHARGRTLAYNNVFYLARRAGLRLSRRGSGSPNQIGRTGGVPELTSGRDADATPAVSTPAEEAVSSSSACAQVTSGTAACLGIDRCAQAMCRTYTSRPRIRRVRSERCCLAQPDRRAFVCSTLNIKHATGAPEEARTAFLSGVHRHPPVALRLRCVAAAANHNEFWMMEIWRAHPRRAQSYS